MGRVPFAIVLPACLVAFALVAGGAACDSTLNLGNPADAGVATTQDSAPPTCQSTCDRLLTTCQLFPPDQLGECLAQCNKTGRPSDLVCVAQTPCATITKVCGNERSTSEGGTDASIIDDFQVRTCQAACDSSSFFDCISAAELKTCRDLCATAPAARRNAYQACASGSGGNCPHSRDCLNLFVGD
jgi:hypothetical protein